MKNLKLFILLAVFSAFCACNSTTTDPVPSTIVTVVVPSSAPDKATVGQNIAFSVAVTAPATLSKIEISKGSTVIATVNTFTTSTASYNFAYTVLPQDAGQTLTFKFSAIDIKGNTKTTEYMVVIAVNTGENPNIRLLNQNALTLASAGSFYASSTNSITNSTNADVTKVDITYGIIGGNPSLVSPAARVANNLSVGEPPVTGWTRTTFAVSSLNYDTVTGADILAATAPTNEVQTVAVNGVYIFQNAAGKRGIIKVKGLTANGTASSSVDVTFDIKIIK